MRANAAGARHVWTGRGLGLFLLVAALLGCAPGEPRSEPARSGSPPTAQPPRTLRIAVRAEPASLATRPFVQQGVALTVPRRAFNAELAVIDADGQPRPFLADALPRLN